MNSPTTHRSGPPARLRRLGVAGAAVLALAATALGLTGAPQALAAPSATPSAPTRSASVDVPADVTAGVAVFDRTTGTFSERHNENGQFRSASVVKLLIALDFLRTRDPRDLSGPDRTRLDAMLRSSDDGAAGSYWSLGGRTAIIQRTVTQLGLTATTNPPSGMEDYWGYVATSAADTVRIYRYILETAPAPVRDYMMGNLRQSTRCGTDGFDQHFGIAGSFVRPWAVKQGWSGFGASGGCTPKPPSTVAGLTGATTTTTPPAPRAAAQPAPRAGAAVDLTREALHTTGTVGAGDRTIVAVFTLHPDGTPYGTAYTTVNRLTRSLDVPGAVHPAGAWFGTWGTGVNVRPQPTTAGTPLTTLPAGVEVLVGCQKTGQQVTIPPYTNTWWAYLPQYGGYITNIYITSPGSQLPGVQVCSS
ncbi:hypothetical protein [Streptomyces sp. NPDC008121]|uniref:hypothetical protein n=1 Tax=Streptomyces sp. NPDC008121 TaxID=3364809 RepID=UPI0036F06E26